MNRLFESDMEVVWDKGSSGLVFYTDGNYWEELEGKGRFAQSQERQTGNSGTSCNKEGLVVLARE